jgi:hypothetical protein
MLAKKKKKNRLNTIASSIARVNIWSVLILEYDVYQMLSPVFFVSVQPVCFPSCALTQRHKNICISTFVLAGAINLALDS